MLSRLKMQKKNYNEFTFSESKNLENFSYEGGCSRQYQAVTMTTQHCQIY